MNWHPDSEFQTVRAAPSLAALIDAAVDLFRAGAYRWDATHQAVVTVDEVFERPGLTPGYRPIAWP